MARIVFVCFRCGGRGKRLGESKLARCNQCGNTFTILDSNTKILPERKPRSEGKSKK